MSNDVERFQDFCRRFINRKVREHFNDLGGDDWRPDFNVSRHFTRWICTHQDTDPMMLTLGRLMVYFFKVQGLLEEPIFMLPATNLIESVSTVAQVILHFQESARDARANNRPYTPLRAQHSIRVRDNFETAASVNTLARKINTIFNTPPFVYDKGRTKFTYQDKSKGHLLIITAINESEAKSVINKMLDIVDDSPNWDLLSESRSNQNFTTTERFRAAGENYKKPQYRPLGKVRFSHAELHIPNMKRNLTLIDKTGTVVDRNNSIAS